MDRQLSPGTILEDRYEIIERIGFGGMGVVYKGAHLELKRKVAIKVLHPAEADNQGMIKRFKIEARSAANIHHPHVVEVVDYGVTPDDRPFFVMEYLIGESLGAKLDREGQLQQGDVVEITEQILIGLMVAHKAGIVHRDMKPENVFLATVEGKRDAVKILDFGISKILAGTASRPPPPIASGNYRLTQVGVVLGTPGYMAPESLFADSNVDSRADLFSVGVLMFEMLTGQRPFRGETPQKALVATASKPVPSIQYLRPDSSKAMQRLITTALAKNPDDRYQTAEEFLDELGAAAVGRIRTEARPCRTRTGMPSVMPPAVSMAPHMISNSLDEDARNEFEAKPKPKPKPEPKPKNKSAPKSRAASERSLSATVPDSVYPSRHLQKNHNRMGQRRPLSISISPIFVLAACGIALVVYFFFRSDSKVTVADNYKDPIDAQIERLTEQGVSPKPRLEPEPEPASTVIRPDGTIVPPSVTIWVESTEADVKVRHDGRVLLERPLIIPGGLEPMHLTFFKKGFHEKTVEITPDREQTVLVKLKKIKK